jgi:repressor LexA
LAVAAVPLLGRVVAGLPVMAVENIEQTLPVPAEWIERGVHFALRVIGESMIDAGIREGDIVIVRQQNTGADGDIVVVTLDGETTVKRLELRGTQTILQPANRRFQPIVVRTESAQVQGVVMGLLRTYGLREGVSSSRRRVKRTQTKRKRHAED